MKKNLIAFLFVFSFSLYSGDMSALEYFKQGENRFFNRNYYGAVESYREAINKNPDYLEAYIELSRSYFMIEEYSEAQLFIEKAQKYGLNNLNLLNMEGRILIGRNRLDTAEKKFSAVLEKEPNNLEANLGMAEVKLLKGDYHGGAVGFRKSLILSPESKRALLSMVILYDSSGQSSSADIYMDMALKHHPSDPEVYLYAAEHFLKTGDLDKAEFYAENAVEVNPELEGPDYLLASIYYDKEDYMKALKALQRRLKKDPYDLQSLFLLSRSLLNQEDTEKALIPLKRILKEAPNDEISRILFEETVRTARDRFSGEVDNLSEYRFRKGRENELSYNFKAASREYRRSRWIDPFSLKSWKASALILDKTGFPKASLNSMKAAEEEGAEDKDFLETIKIKEHSIKDGLADTLDIDQFSLEMNKHEIDIFYTADKSLFHYSSEDILAEYFRYHLIKYNTLKLEESIGEVSGFSDAYRRARTSGSDYFVMLEFSEHDRSFFMKADLYLSRTGHKIKTFSLLRMGKGRIQDSVSSISESLFDFLPLKAYLIRLDEDRGVINLGRINGVEEGDVFSVFRKNSITPSGTPPFVNFREEDWWGDLEIKMTDEAVSSGEWKNRGPFSLAASGDEAVLTSRGGESEEDNGSESEDSANENSSGINAEREDRDIMLDEDLKNQLLMLQ